MGLRFRRFFRNARRLIYRMKVESALRSLNQSAVFFGLPQMNYLGWLRCTRKAGRELSKFGISASEAAAAFMRLGAGVQ